MDKGSFFLVRETGLEPVRRETHAPQTCLSASSSTRARLNVCYYITLSAACQLLF